MLHLINMKKVDLQYDSEMKLFFSTTTIQSAKKVEKRGLLCRSSSIINVKHSSC